MNSSLTDPKVGGYIATILGTLFLVGVVAADHIEDTFASETPKAIMVENFANESFYNTTRQNVARDTKKYAKPDGSMPGGQQTVNLNSSGDQLLSYQIYQQAVNAATPTLEQLNSISGQSHEQTGEGAVQLGGGLSSKTAPYDVLTGNLYDSEFQAVNFANERAQKISACAQNAPTFVATSLLPSPSIPGQQSWDINAPQNILANQNFLSATQQIGIDTVLGSTRNQSWDIRNNIPNPINVVSPWLNTDILPDLEKRPLDNFIPNNGLYGCGPSGCGVNNSFPGQ
jgi:hypothetical protein